MRLPTHRIFLFTLTALLCQGLVGSACSRATADPVPEKIAIFYTNECQSELYPGGSMNPMGGMARRATVLGRQDTYPELLVDIGDFSTRTRTPYGLHKQEYYLQLSQMLGYAAFNVGPREFGLGASGLRALDQQTGGILVAANTVDQAGASVLPPYRVVEVEGLKVGIIGLLTEQWPVDQKAADPLTTTDPYQAMEALWEQVSAESDIQILLSQLTDDEVRVIANLYPGLDLILGGPKWRGATEMKPVELNGVPYAKVGMHGKYLGRVDLTLDATDRDAVKVAGFEGELIGVGSDIPDNAAVTAVLEEYRASSPPPPAPPQGYPAETLYRYAAATNCGSCHADIYAGYLRTPHARAFQSLQAKGEERNPGCLPCHTVGYGEAGGYGSREKGPTYMLADVQCESCHGAAADHAALAMQWTQGNVAAKPTDWKIERPKPAAETCTQCHNPDNDPHWLNGEWPYAALVAHVACTQWLPPPRQLAPWEVPH